MLTGIYNRPQMSKRLSNSPPNMGLIIITSINVGNEYIKSTNRIIMVSTKPPKYAEIVPKIIPPIIEIKTGSAAAVRVVRAPHISLPRRSYAYFVVPKGCADEGSSKGIPPGGK